MIAICFHVFSYSLFSGESLYDIPFRWVDENNQEFQLKQCRGKFVVMTMAYTSCRSQCPLLMKKMRSISDLLKPKEGEVEFVILTMDPRVDTPQRLKGYKKSQHVDLLNWRFLRGGEGDTRRISVLLGIGYQKDEESGHFMHDNKLILLDKNGEVSFVLNGLETNSMSLVKRIKKRSLMKAIKSFFKIE